MKLTELDPSWCRAGGDGVTRDGIPVPLRKGIGLLFDCPCGCGERNFVPFKNPIDGGECLYSTAWQRTGDTFDILTLTPSIKKLSGCGWHGFITNGEAVTC